MERVKINFTDFWDSFDVHNNYFTRILSKYYEVEISESPDIIIYFGYGMNHLKYDCFRVYCNWENHRVNWMACDLAFGFDHLIDSRFHRLPNWVWYADPALLMRPKPDPETILKEKRLFCNFVVSNPKSRRRLEFYQKLSRYKKIDSGGRYLNNVGGPVDDKRAFVRNYKFTIAFENSSYPGYATEKLFEPMLENSIPIYWGDPLVDRDFDTGSFINYQDFGTDEKLIERIIEVDRNDDLYMRMLSQPWYKDNKMPDCCREELIIEHFKKIFSSMNKMKPVAHTYKKHIYTAQIKINNVDHILNNLFHYRDEVR